MLEDYPDFCYNQVGSFALEYIEYFEDLRKQLSKANVEITLPEYVSMMFFTMGVVGLFSTVLLSVFFILSIGAAGIIMAFMFSIIATMITGSAFYLYPGIMMKSRASKIRDTLPFATMYLATLSGTGTSLPNIFKNLAEVDEYGEVSKEAEKISRDIETFGMDVSEALERAANRTPSDDFKELVWGINHVITTGGSLKQFLQERSDKLMDDYQRRIEEFSKTLSLLVEMYITVIIVGSIIFTSMSAVISSFSSSISPTLLVNIQVLAIFFGIPMI